MEGTHKLRPLSGANVDEARPPVPLLLAVALIAACLAYVALLAQPVLARGLGTFWGSLSLAAKGAEWVIPVVAGSVALAGATFCALVLSAFIRGVQTAPYVWLSPVLAGFSSVVLARMRIELPLAYVPVALFSGLAGLLMLGGGALLQVRGFASKCSGLLLLLLPLATLIAGYARLAGGFEPAFRTLDSSSLLFLFVLALTSLGVALVAFVARPASASADVSRRALQAQEHRELLAQAIERARISEMRQADAERRAQLAEQNLRAQAGPLRMAPAAGLRVDNTADFVALARPSLGSPWLLAVPGVAFMCLAAVAYVGAYRPLARRVAAQQAFEAEAAREHAAEIDTLRKRLDTERANLYAALAAERAKTVPVPEPRKDEAEASQQVEHKPPAVERVSSRHSANRQKARVRSTPKVEQSAPEANPNGGLKETVNDDPIGGLEGL